MALPAHLEKYDALVDLIGDVLVREIDQEGGSETARDVGKAWGRWDRPRTGR